MKPQQWEYTSVDVLGWQRKDLVRKLLDELQKLGREGWEVCGEFNHELGVGRHSQVVLLKRPIYPSALPPPPPTG